VKRFEYGGILDAIGNTPLVHLRRISDRVNAQVFAKLERFNPGGSIKDRPARGMLLAKIRTGELEPSRSVVVESSSGNLAIGMAQLCRYFGLRFICVVDPKTPEPTLAILRSYGVTVERVDQADAHSGEYLAARLRRVRELVASVPGAYWPDQYANPLNPLANEATMGEIAEALGGGVDYLLCAVSTTGTLLGCAQYVRKHDLRTQLVAVDAVGSVLFTDEPARYRLIPGYGASVRPALLDPTAADQVIHVTDLECVVGCRQLMLYEAVLAGGSSGAAVAGLTKLAPSIPEGSTCVLIFPDGGDRYLDTIHSDEWVESQFGEVFHLWKDEAQGAVPC
jgi:cysteine synthase A